MPRSSLCTYIAVGLGVPGVAMTATAYGHDNIDLLTVGVTLALAAVVALMAGWMAALIRRPQRATDDAYDLGHQVGYDLGYMDGRRIAKPTVVPIHPPMLCKCQEVARVPAQAPLREVASNRLSSGWA